MIEKGKHIFSAILDTFLVLFLIIFYFLLLLKINFADLEVSLVKQIFKHTTVELITNYLFTINLTNLIVSFK